ncbi:MAG: pyridoxal-dependent decarboxylase [Gemmatimonadota bacterium]
MTEAGALGDMPPEEFQRQVHRVAEWMTGYLQTVESLPVLSRVEPGDLLHGLPPSPPQAGEAMEAILEDFQELVVPGITHWNHPGFLGYFAITGSGPGVLAEMLAAALNVNAMLWRTSPAGTELEQRVVAWMLELLGLPPHFMGVIQDTASSSSLAALAGARHRAYPESRESGLFGLPRGRVYASQEAHSSIDKAVMALGLGKAGLRRIEVDSEYQMRPGALEKAIQEDRAAGIRPVAVVATLGTTSTASCDPVAEILPIVREHGMWLHVDAAYGGAAAMLGELSHLFKGWEEADSVVVNPHKWLFTPVDCSLLFLSDGDSVRDALSLTPEYLRTAEGTEVLNLMDYGVPLGRRFRALKLWFVLRYFGARGLQSRIRGHIDLAKRLAELVGGSPHWDVVAPVHFSTVVLRWSPPAVSRDECDALGMELMERVNRQGEVFLSHTRLEPGVCIRVSVGNLRTEWRHLERAWDLLQEGAAALAPGV